MATGSANLPIESQYLARAWFVLAAILLAAATVVTMALAARSTAAGGTGLGPVRDNGPAQEQGAPIVVKGTVCGQCR
jgi:hypothetical protein